tara:strand:- start:584 stop:754 length:171 start_codon:yes stop_codon:yes gene_type:complete
MVEKQEKRNERKIEKLKKREGVTKKRVEKEKLVEKKRKKIDILLNYFNLIKWRIIL